MGFSREGMGKQKKIWKTKEDMENKRRYGKQKRKPFFKGFPFCEVSSGVEPLYTVLQTVT